MDDHTQEKRLTFAEEMGVEFEQLGSTRMLGRVLGALMVADPPETTAEELATFLQASRGSISQATRQLVQLGLIERINRTGVRRDFYRVRRNAWVEASRHKTSEIHAMQALFKRGLRAMEGASDEARLALTESLRFMEFWEKESQALFARWEAQSEQTNGDRHPDL